MFRCTAVRGLARGSSSAFRPPGSRGLFAAGVYLQFLAQLALRGRSSILRCCAGEPWRLPAEPIGWPEWPARRSEECRAEDAARNGGWATAARRPRARPAAALIDGDRFYDPANRDGRQAYVLWGH